MLQINFIIISYILIITIIIARSKAKQENQTIILIINGLVLLWMGVQFICPAEAGVLRLLFDWSPLILLPLFHRETDFIPRAYGHTTYDEAFIRFEKKYFPFVMNIHYHNHADSKLFSEFLHLCYLSFYLLIYGIPLYFYLLHDFNKYYESLFAILLLLFSCYLTHALIPVSGPRNIFEKIKDHRSQGFFFRLVHKILENGSTYGTAFPSGHTGLACVVLLITWHVQLSLFYCILPFALGLIISTIYGRFHYLIDVIVGFFYALIAFFITVWLYP